MSAPRGRAGSTLLELMVAVALFMFLMSGAASMTVSAIKNQIRLVYVLVVDNAATVARRSVMASLGSATRIILPGPGEVSTALTTWSNLDDDGVTAFVAGRPVTFHHHCVSADGTSLHYYSGAAPMPAIVCGNEAKGAFHIAIAGGPSFRVTARFYRPAGTPNLVQTDMTFRLDSHGNTRSSAVRTQMITLHANY